MLSSEIKPDRDSGNRSLDLDAGVHQTQACIRTCSPWRSSRWIQGTRKSSAARKGNPPVAGIIRSQRLLGKRAMSDFSPAGASDRADLAGGVRREVVEVHEALFGVFLEVVDLLSIVERAQRKCRQNLRLASRKQP